MSLLRLVLRRPVLYRAFLRMLTSLPSLLPADRLRETPHLLAFFHPRPAHPFHVLLIPRQPAPTLADLDPSSLFLPDLIAAVQSLVAEYHLGSYRLVVNGGSYQDFPHLHFHLLSDREP